MLFLLGISLWNLQAARNTPNVIYILADDLGYGDLSHAGGKVATPHCDRLADEGMRCLLLITTYCLLLATCYLLLATYYLLLSTYYY